MEKKRPNILMIMVDQMRYPCFGYGKDGGFLDPIKRILGFQDGIEDDNKFREFFPGFSALADNAVVFNNHKAASSACVPSRTALFTGQYGTRRGYYRPMASSKTVLMRIFHGLIPKSFPLLVTGCVQMAITPIILANGIWLGKTPAV